MSFLYTSLYTVNLGVKIYACLYWLSLTIYVHISCRLKDLQEIFSEALEKINMDEVFMEDNSLDSTSI